MAMAFSAPSRVARCFSNRGETSVFSLAKVGVFARVDQARICVSLRIIFFLLRCTCFYAKALVINSRIFINVVGDGNFCCFTQRRARRCCQQSTSPTYEAIHFLLARCFLYLLRPGRRSGRCADHHHQMKAPCPYKGTLCRKPRCEFPPAAAQRLSAAAT